MGAWKKGSRGLRLLLPMGVSAMALIAFGRAPVAQMSELDAFQRAVNTQSPQDALAFIDRFGTSHLVPDLIDLLEPDVAVQVCSSLGDGPPSARNACEEMRAAIATAPAAGTAAPTPISASAAPGASSIAPADGPPPGESPYFIPPVFPDPAAGSVTADDGAALDPRQGGNREADGRGNLADAGGSGGSGGSGGDSGSGDSGSGGSGGSGSGGSGSGGSGGSGSGGGDDGGGSDDGGGADDGGDSGNGGGPGGGGALGGLGNAVGGALGGLGNAVGGALGGLGNGLGNGGNRPGGGGD